MYKSVLKERTISRGSRYGSYKGVKYSVYRYVGDKMQVSIRFGTDLSQTLKLENNMGFDVLVDKESQIMCVRPVQLGAAKPILLHKKKSGLCEIRFAYVKNIGLPDYSFDQPKTEVKNGAVFKIPKKYEPEVKDAV